VVLRGFLQFSRIFAKALCLEFFEKGGEAKSYKQSHPAVLITKCPICNLLGKKVLILYNNFMMCLIIEIGLLEVSLCILGVLRSGH
jgi:hypothetical protein